MPLLPRDTWLFPQTYTHTHTHTLPTGGCNAPLTSVSNAVFMCEVLRRLPLTFSLRIVQLCSSVVIKAIAFLSRHNSLTCSSVHHWVSLPFPECVSIFKPPSLMTGSILIIFISSWTEVLIAGPYPAVFPDHTTSDTLTNLVLVLNNHLNVYKEGHRQTDTTGS